MVLIAPYWCSFRLVVRASITVAAIEWAMGMQSSARMPATHRAPSSEEPPWFRSGVGWKVCVSPHAPVGTFRHSLRMKLCRANRGDLANAGPCRHVASRNSFRGLTFRNRKSYSRADAAAEDGPMPADPPSPAGTMPTRIKTHSRRHFVGTGMASLAFLTCPCCTNLVGQAAASTAEWSYSESCRLFAHQSCL